MTPFEPKGDVAEWRAIFDLIKDKKPDDVIPLEDIEDALGRSLGSNRGPVYRAIKELEKSQYRTLATVRGVGYRVARPEEHLDLGLSHSRSARKQLRRGLQRAEATNRGELEPVAAARLEAFEATTSRLVQFIGRMAVAVDDHAKRIDTLESDKDKTSERVSVVEEALKRQGLL